MIAVDTQLLVYAHRTEVERHAAALHRLVELAESGQPWAIPWPCVHEFLNTVTRPHYFRPASSMEDALTAMQSWFSSPTLHLLGEGPHHFSRLRTLLIVSGVRGPKVHDARIAAICLGHGIEALWSIDRDFSWFPELSVVNPLLTA